MKSIIKAIGKVLTKLNCKSKCCCGSECEFNTDDVAVSPQSQKHTDKD